MRLGRLKLIADSKLYSLNDTFDIISYAEDKKYLGQAIVSHIKENISEGLKIPHPCVPSSSTLALY